MLDCDHREICRLGDKNSRYKLLLEAIKDGFARPQSDAKGVISQSIIPSQESIGPELTLHRDVAAVKLLSSASIADISCRGEKKKGAQLVASDLFSESL